MNTNILMGQILGKLNENERFSYSEELETDMTSVRQWFMICMDRC